MSIQEKYQLGEAMRICRRHGYEPLLKGDIEPLLKQAFNEGAYIRLFRGGWAVMEEKLDLLFSLPPEKQ